MLLLAAWLPPKPKVLVVEAVLADCAFCGEVQLIELQSNKELKDSKLIVEVTRDPGRIGRGFAQLGQRLELGMPPGGAMSTVHLLGDVIEVVTHGEGRAWVAQQLHAILVGGRVEEALRDLSR